MATDLQDLLCILPSDVNGVLEEFIPSGCEERTDINFTFHAIRFQDELPRTKSLIGILCNSIPSFCLNRDKVRDVNPLEIREIWKKARNKLVQTKGHTGEPGELLVYFLLEGYKLAPKILSKMNLKTNPKKHVHGSDGVHLGLEEQKIILYFGESKLYSSHTDAIRDALDSVKGFIEPTTPETNLSLEDFEINVIEDHIDLPDGDLRERVLNALNPYHAERDNLSHRYVCFIGFDLEEIKQKCEKTNFSTAYQRKAESCYKNAIKNIENEPALKSLRWEFFFLPFGSVEQFRRDFIKEVNS